MVWILKDHVVKPFAYFSNEISMVLEVVVNPRLMVWDLREVVVKPFTHFSNEI